MKLEKWSIVRIFDNPYEAPEMAITRLKGLVYDNPKFDNGTEVVTSTIESIDPVANTVTTYSGSVYVLGEIDPEYESYFPDAVKRFWEGNKDLIKTKGGLIL